MSHDTNGDEKANADLADAQSWEDVTQQDLEHRYSDSHRSEKQLRLLIDDYREQAASILRKAGFSPEKLNESDKADLECDDHPKRRDIPRMFIADGDAAKLRDPTDPASAAWHMLRWVRLLEELLNESDVDIFTVAYAFELGRMVKRAALGMQFPDIAERFRDRDYRLLSKQGNKKRHAQRDKAKALVLQEWQKDPSRFPSAEKAGNHFADWLEAQGYSYEPRTVVTWIREYAKAKGIRLR